MHTPANLIDYATMPPQPIASYPVLLPRVDADGLAVDGIRLPVIVVPLATYTGWNPRAEGYGAGALCTNQGAVIPFRAGRVRSVWWPAIRGRRSRSAIRARAPTSTRCVGASERLVAERLLLPADAAGDGAAAKAGALAGLAPTQKAHGSRLPRPAALLAARASSPIPA